MPSLATASSEATELAVALPSADSIRTKFLPANAFRFSAADLIRSEKTLGPHRYGCLMAILPESLRKEITDWVIENIPEEHLGVGGRELRSHVTVKYGFTVDSEENIAAITELIKRTGPLRATLGAINQFKGNKDGDVLYIEVLEMNEGSESSLPSFPYQREPYQTSPDQTLPDATSPHCTTSNVYCTEQSSNVNRKKTLHELNAELTASFPCFDKYKDYRPHVCLAYLNPEVSAFYENITPPFLNREIILDNFEYNPADGDAVTIGFSMFSGTKSTEATPKEEKSTYKVVLVNAAEVRSQSLEAQEFGGWATHVDYDFIPKDAIYIDKDADETDQKYFLINATAFLNAIAEGKNKDEAYDIGLMAERAERNKETQGGDGVRPYHQEIPEDVYLKLWKIINQDGENVEVWIVDGLKVREMMKTDFVEGGHAYVYSFVPEPEVWIEHAVEPDERDFTLLHEFTERRSMKHEQLGYDDAHDKASKVEFAAREKAKSEGKTEAGAPIPPTVGKSLLSDPEGLKQIRLRYRKKASGEKLVWRCMRCGTITNANRANPYIKVGKQVAMLCEREHSRTMHVCEQVPEWELPSKSFVDYEIKGITSSVQSAGRFLAQKWSALENRYGRRAALSMALAMVVSLPIPGNIAAVIGVAEAIRGLHGYASRHLRGSSFAGHKPKNSYFATCERDELGHCKMLWGYEAKGEGTCKQGERADLTGCTPASKEPHDGSRVKQPKKQSPKTKKVKQGTTYALPPKGEKIATVSAPHDPDPHKVDPNYGVAMNPRVGVNGSDVPPPPKDIPRLPNLTEKERKAESRFIDIYLKNPDAVAKAYRNRLKAGTIGDAPNIFNTDDAKLLSPDYNPQGVDENAVKDARSTYNVAVHQVANVIAKRAFLQHLDEEVGNLPEEQRIVLVTSGGVAAGKGYALANAEGTSDLASRVAAVWDAAGEQNAAENPWVLQECKKRGIRPIFAYIHADPHQTWENEQRGVIERAGKKGRMVDARVFSDSYGIGAKNFKSFAERNVDDAEFIFIDNSTAGKPTITDRMPEAALKVDAEHLYARASKVIHERSHDLKPAVVRGGTIGHRIWGKPKVKA